MTLADLTSTPTGSRQPSTARRWAIGLGLVACLILGSVLWINGPTTSGTTSVTTEAIQHPAGMHVVFSDNFAGSSFDTGKWSTCYPWAAEGAGCTNFSNPELEWYEPSQDRVTRGVLSLTASKTATKGLASNGRSMTYPWRSGMVTTHNSFDFTYGYVEVIARMPRGDGLWSALWLLPETASWPPEIDLAELWGDNPTLLSVNFHGASSASVFRTFQTSDVTRGWHTFAVDWEPTSIVWYVDGKEVYRYEGGDIPSTRMFFIADLAVTNSVYSHPTVSTPTTASMEIRRVTIFQH